ncbi:MAG: DUF4125 family protein [Lachnospiraceae bacterium]|nr:DUF4125 family protein [Lachnospiraceae bacterium]
MDINKIIAEYDAMFGAREPREILFFLGQNLDRAKEEKDVASEIILLNEIIGFCRDAGFKEEGVRCCRALEQLMNELDFSGRIEYATTMLNIANAYRGFGMFEESEKHYSVCSEMYEKMLPEGDFLFAGLYNNRGLLFQEMKRWEDAAEDFRTAIAIADRYPEHEIEQATSRANLAAALMEAGPDFLGEAEARLQEAIDIFEKDGGKDFHYTAALAALGTLYFNRKDYYGSAALFKKAMDLLYAGTGASEGYMRLKENYELAMSCAGESKEKAPDEISALEESRRFFEEVLRPLIEERIPDAMKVIAAGFSGEGSEHFGFDDEYSRDHDYARGCCIWIGEVHTGVYGEKLRALYNEAYINAFGAEPDLKAKRQGVLEIDDYFERLTGISKITMRYFAKDLDAQLYRMDDEQLAGIAAAVNGELFCDGEGSMTRLRKYFIEDMPEDFRRRKLGTLIHLFSQAGQYNYLRSIKRGDYVTALLYEARAVQAMLQAAFYLNRKYPPYIKLLRRGAAELERLPELGDIAEAIADMPSGREVKLENGVDNKSLSFDVVALLLLECCREQGLVKSYEKTRPFADRYAAVIAGLEEQEEPAQDGDSRAKLIDAIIALEWEQFDRTINEGGRADCQDNWQTFSIMRKSQYLTWPEELLVSFYTDLTEAKEQGRNLISEKYGRMMESTAPERYAEIKKYFTEPDEERKQIQEEIVAIQTKWMEELAEEYPKMAGNARKIHTYEDTEWDTSYETYLRGEIGTYSPSTLILYGRFIASLARAGRNLAEETMNNTALLLGYKSLKDAEERL